jgi:methylated-DNA-[protein]-cysteine S-methyltransferase
MKYQILESPVGILTIAGTDSHLHYLLFSTGEKGSGPLSEWEDGTNSVLRETGKQLKAYFGKKLTRFELPLSPAGTPFQLEVWNELTRIPYGHVISYGELARRIGKPSASRAVGAANGDNPISIIVPCHRVIGGNGSLTGYGGGLPVKIALLELEGIPPVRIQPAGNTRAKKLPFRLEP